MGIGSIFDAFTTQLREAQRVLTVRNLLTQAQIATGNLIDIYSTSEQSDVRQSSDDRPSWPGWASGPPASCLCRGTGWYTDRPMSVETPDLAEYERMKDDLIAQKRDSPQELREGRELITQLYRERYEAYISKLRATVRRTSHYQIYPCICTIKTHAGERREWLRRESRLNDRMRANLTIERFDPSWSPDQAMMKAHATKYIRGEAKPWLCMFGNSGIGKTHIAVAIANALIAQGVHCVYFTWDDFFDYLRAGIHDDGIEQRFASISIAPVLVLDDLRVELVRTDFEREYIHRILDQRYQDASPFIFTSNNALSEFPSRISSRVRDTIISTNIVAEGPDVRTAEESDRQYDETSLPF